MSAHTHTYTHMHTHTQWGVFIVCLEWTVFVCTHTYIHTHAYTHTVGCFHSLSGVDSICLHTHTYTHMHTHTQWGVFIVCLEWTVFVCTHSLGPQWKQDFEAAPSWVKGVMDKGKGRGERGGGGRTFEAAPSWVKGSWTKVNTTLVLSDKPGTED